MADLVALEGHVIDVIGLCALPCGRDRTALAGVAPMEHAVGQDLVSRLVDGERTHLCPAVGQWREKALHPLGVGLQTVNALQRGSLARKGRPLMAVLLAFLPSLTCLTRVEESFGDLLDGSHAAHLPLMSRATSSNSDSARRRVQRSRWSTQASDASTATTQRVRCDDQLGRRLAKPRLPESMAGTAGVQAPRPRRR